MFVSGRIVVLSVLMLGCASSPRASGFSPATDRAAVMEAEAEVQAQTRTEAFLPARSLSRAPQAPQVPQPRTRRWVPRIRLTALPMCRPALMVATTW